MTRTTIFCLLIVFLALNSFAQRYTQSGVVHTEIKAFTKNDVQINGNSKEMEVEYPPNEHKMVLRLDPHTILSDNIEFNKQLDQSLLGSFVFLAEIDGSKFDFQSKYNETFEVEAEATINNITLKIPIVMVVNNKKTNNSNTLIIVGKGEIGIEDFELQEIFPDLTGVIKFQFTQNLVIKY
jgi:hypothetical protein